MTLSVEDNVLRCFSKFGEKVVGQAARTQMRWHSTSFYKPAAGWGDEKDSARSPAIASGRPIGPSSEEGSSRSPATASGRPIGPSSEEGSSRSPATASGQP